MPGRRCPFGTWSGEPGVVARFGYEPVFAKAAAEFLLQLPKRRQKQVIALSRQLASQPHLRSDYTLPDDSGRPIEHLLIEEFVFAYWIDHAEQEVRITDIEDAS